MMTSLKKKAIVFLLIPLVVLLFYLLWPLQSAEFHISEDEGALAEKTNFLNTRTAPSPVDAPNILLITVDDLGMADVSLYGEGDIETPHIDRLGREGVVFENAYVTSPVCAPSRAALITGRYQQRFGFEFTMHERYLRNRLEYLGFRYFVDSEPWKPRWTDRVPNANAIHQQGLPLSEISLADVLKKQGYHTGIVGKWHLGWSKEKRPSAFGFDEQYGFFNSHTLYAPEGSPGIVDQKIEGDWTDPFIWSGQRNGPHAISRNYVEVEEKGYLTDRITDESIRFMQQSSGKPFFLWASYNAPHTPLQAPEEYVEQFAHIEDPVRRVYRAMISNLDDNLGRLLDFINQAQLAENTLIFFISDNGGAAYTLTTDNGRYEGGKNTEFEGGVKVPMIIRWTGVLPADRRYEPMVSSMDVFSTALDAASAEWNTSRPVDGVSLLPYLTNSLDTEPHKYLFWQRGISQVVRSREWKLMLNAYSGDTLLYNLQENTYEFPDQSALYPETVRRLGEEITAWQKIHSLPLWPSVIYFGYEKDGDKIYFEQ